MLKGENIICFSSSDWVSHNKTSKRHLMEIFSKENRVLYIESIGTRNPGLNKSHISRIVNRLKLAFQGPRKPSDVPESQNLWIDSPVLIPFHENKVVQKLNQILLAGHIRRLIRKLNLKNPILWFYLPTAVSVLGKLEEKLVVYHSVDEWATYPGQRGPEFLNMDEKLFRKANVVFAANPLMVDRKKSLNPNTHWMPHAVNASDFQGAESSNTELPKDLSKIPGPRIAMIGAVSEWVDWDPIVYLARKHPEWSLVLIGPIGYDADLSKIKGIENIHLLGKKDYKDLKAYYQGIDVCLISFQNTEHIQFCYPTRFYEHLAAGKPIVSSDFPVAHQFPPDLVRIADSLKGFEEAVLESLKSNSEDLKNRRQQLAKENSWVSRAEKMSQIIQKAL